MTERRTDQEVSAEAAREPGRVRRLRSVANRLGLGLQHPKNTGRPGWWVVGNNGAVTILSTLEEAERYLTGRIAR
jgi:hypothetical protein